MDINVDLLQWSINLFDKIASGSSIKNANISKKRISRKITQTSY